MTKQDFLSELRRELAGLPKHELEEQLTFYSEMIDDHIEDGLTEEDAVTAVGFPEQIARQANAEAPTTVPQKRRLKAREIVLLILGSPLWLSLGIAAVAVILSLYVSLWAVAIALWAVFGSLIACAFGGVLAGAGFIVGGHLFSGIAMIGGGIVCAGLSIFAFYGCKAAAKGLVMLTKRCFVKKVGVA